MTRDEILQMPEGCEMDALVAAIIEPKPEQAPDYASAFLSLVRGSGDEVKSPGGAWIGTMDFEDGDIPYWAPLSFSTDIAAAWQVVDEMIRNKWSFDVGQLEDQRWVARFGRSDEEAVTAPLAICRAAVIALLKWEEGGMIDD